MARTRRDKRQTAVSNQRLAVSSQHMSHGTQLSTSDTRHPTPLLGWWVVGGALLLGLVVYAVWFQTWLAARPTPALTYTNPLIDRDHPQPTVLAALNDYWVFTSGPDTNLFVMRSPDMVQWSPVGEGLPTPGVWAEPGTVQSPDVVTGPRRGYLLYYTARSKADGRLCLSLATSEKPAGPYDDTRETPLVCGATDASSFVDEDGSRYLLWQTVPLSPPSIGRPEGQSAIRIQRVTQDGLNLEGEAHDVLTVSQPWEGQAVGAPTLIKRAGRYYLLYSGNTPDNPDYAIGYAVGDSPLGPFKKPLDAPILQSTDTLCRPGGQAVVLDMVGQDWLVYQSQTCGAGSAPAPRTLHLDRLMIDGDRLSVSPSSGPQPAPMLRR